MFLRAGILAATALLAVATPRTLRAKSVASVLDTGHHAKQEPDMIDIPDRALGRLPDLSPVGGISAAINKLPGAASFFKGSGVTNIVSDNAMWGLARAPAPAAGPASGPAAASPAALASPRGAGTGAAIRLLREGKGPLG